MEVKVLEYLLLNEEQKDYAATAKMILEKELKPQLHDLELANDGLGKYPLDVHYKMAEAGFYAMALPEKRGGLEFDFKTKGAIIEAMAQVDAGFAFSFHNTGNFYGMIELTSMPDDMKQEWADKHLTGDARGAFCFTESEAGSDPKNMKTKARKDGNEWVINGTKCFVSHAADATFFVVCAYTDKEKGPSKGTTFFFVEADREGISIGKRENKMGLKLSSTCEVNFSDVRVPEDHVVGEVGDGFGKGLATIANERPLNACMALGIADAAIENVVNYTKERRQFGKRIIDHQGLGFMISDMIERTEATRALTYYVLDCVDKKVPTQYLNFVVKKFASDSTMKICLDAVQAFGGYGYMKDYPVEKLMRDAKIFQIFSGTNQIQQKNILRAVAGRDPQKTK